MTTNANFVVERLPNCGPSVGTTGAPPPLKFEVERTFHTEKRRPLEYIVKLDSNRRIVDKFFDTHSSTCTSQSTTPSRSPFKISEQSAFRPVDPAKEKFVIQPNYFSIANASSDPNLDNFWARNEVLLEIQPENSHSSWNVSGRRLQKVSREFSDQEVKKKMDDLPGPETEFEYVSKLTLPGQSQNMTKNLFESKQNEGKSPFLVDETKIESISYGPSIATLKNGRQNDDTLKKLQKEMDDIDDVIAFRPRKLSTEMNRRTSLQQKKNCGAIKRLSAIFDKSKSIEHGLCGSCPENDSFNEKNEENSRKTSNLSQNEENKEKSKFLARMRQFAAGLEASYENNENENETIKATSENNTYARNQRKHKTLDFHAVNEEKWDSEQTGQKWSLWNEIKARKDGVASDVVPSFNESSREPEKIDLYSQYILEKKNQTLPARTQKISRSFTTNYEDYDNSPEGRTSSNVPYKINILNNIVSTRQKPEPLEDSKKIDTKTVSSKAQLFERIAKCQKGTANNAQPVEEIGFLRNVKQKTAETRKKFERAKTMDFLAKKKMQPAKTRRVYFAEDEEYISCDSSLENLLKEDLYRHEDQNSRLKLDEKAKLFESKWKKNERLRNETIMAQNREEKNSKNKRGEARRKTQPITMDELSKARSMAADPEAKVNYQPHRFIQTGLDRSGSKTSIHDLCIIPDYKVKDPEISQKQAQQLIKCKKVSLW